jgi:DNA-binding response OmpR family regulator
MAKKRILVVDDQPSIVYSCADQLQEAGFEARGVVDGTEAIELYKSEGFDVVLTDLRMPGVDGLQVLEAIMAYDPEASVVIMTGFGTVEAAADAMRSGAKEFITKPYDIDALIAKVRGLLGRRGQRDARGNLRDLPLASIIWVNCCERNRARLVVRRQGQTGFIYFEEGSIVHAILEDQEGETVIHELLTWEDGTFSLQLDIPPPKNTIKADWAAFLPEGMRHMDEARSGSDHQGSPEGDSR